MAIRRFLPCLSAVVLAAACAGCKGQDRAPGCIRSGPRSGGPGDVGDFYPASGGDSWTYEVSMPGQAPALHSLELSGPAPATGIFTLAGDSLGDAPANPVAAWFVKDASGVQQVTGGGTGDGLTDFLLPSELLYFPLQAGQTFLQLDCVGLDSGTDLDGDGRTDPFDYRADVSVGAAEPVTLPFATLPALPVQTRTSLTVHGTRGRSGTATAVFTDWYAPGVGLVQSRYDDTSSGSAREQLSTRLVGYSVGGQARGLIGLRTLATDLAPAGSDLPMPGRPTLGFDGSAHLLVSARAGTSAAAWPVAGDGSVGAGVALAGSYGALSFDGSSYLAVLDGCAASCSYGGAAGDALIRQRLAPGGTLLDAPAFVVQAGTTVYRPAVASGASRHLVAYTRWDGGAVEVRAALLDSGGAPLDDFPIRGPAPQLGAEPAVAFDGQRFLVAWTEGTELHAARVSPGGTLLDPASITVSASAGAKELGGVACGGGRCLVVWADARSGLLAGAGYPLTHLYAARLDGSGAVLDGDPATGGIPVNTLADVSKQGASVAFDGEAFVVAWWIDGYTAPAGVFAARVSVDGALLGAAGEQAGVRLSRVSRPAARAVAPFVSPDGPRRTLIAWAYNAETAGEAKAIEAAWVQW